LSELQKEQVKFNTEAGKLIFLFFLATGGGTISLILSEASSGKENFFIAGGIAVAATSFVVLYNLYKHTRSLLKEA
jgi:hypothetical protein